MLKELWPKKKNCCQRKEERLKFAIRNWDDVSKLLIGGLAFKSSSTSVNPFQKNTTQGPSSQCAGFLQITLTQFDSSPTLLLNNHSIFTSTYHYFLFFLALIKPARCGSHLLILILAQYRPALKLENDYKDRDTLIV